MTTTIEFFFDFISPFAYLAHCRLPALADKYGYGLVYKPFNLFAAKLAAGSTGPGTPQIPAKFRYISADLRRWEQKYGVALVMPWLHKPGAPLTSEKPQVPKEVGDTSRANKGTFFALERGQGREYVTRLWGATFGSGGYAGNEGLLRDVARQMGWSPDEFLTFVQSGAAERLYEKSNKEAQSRGVFGAPTMMVGDEMWWGNDRLGLLEEYLAAHPADARPKN
jgi:2-hydroxychromene-2-carboxylate isomerase